MINVRAFFLTIGLALVCAMQFVPGVGAGDARATVLWTGGPDSPCYVASFNNYPAACSRQAAYDACMTHNNYWKTHGSPNASGCVVTATVSGGIKGSYGSKLSSTNRADYFNWGFSCAAGSTWDDTTKKCASDFDGSKCLAENAKLGADSGKPRPSLTTERCVAVPGANGACSFKMATSGPDYTVTTVGGLTVYRGVMEYTGLACGVTPPPATPDATEQIINSPTQECVPAATGETYCVKKDGKHCATASTGRQICWAPGETGEKTDGPVLQVRSPGALPTTPQTVPPQGESLEASGDPVTAQTQTATGAITTTTQNYKTVNGTNAGGAAPDAGENSNGTSGQSPGGQGTSGDGSVQELTDFMKERLQGNDDGGTAGLDAVAGTAVAGEVEVGGDGFDGSGFGYGSTCPAPVSVEVMGQTITLDASGVVCNWVTIGGWFVLMIAGIACMRIVVGGGKG